MSTEPAPTAGARRPEATSLRHAVFRLSRRLRSERADDALSDGQTAVLGFLNREGARTLGALADHERVSPPSMNRTVNGLERAGYVERVGDPEDGRRVRIVITPAGSEVIAETTRRRDAWLDAALDDLDDEDVAALARALPVLEALAER